jgi:hypothetical protein
MSDEEKKRLRAARFNVPESEQSKVAARAARFGLTNTQPTSSPGPISSKKAPVSGFGVWSLRLPVILIKMTWL